jgi:diacylglycerol O-acyltransferase / wax synthase
VSELDTVEFTWARDLSAFDYLMYRADMDSRSRTSLLSIDILDVVPDWDRLRQDIERATRVALPLRRKVVAPIVPLTAARWVVDPDFDLDYHLRRISLPAPGSERQLLDLAQTLHATPLDLGRPLWEATLVEGLDTPDGGKAALIWKMSHAVTDGVGGMMLERMTRSEERDPDWGPMPPVPVPEDLSAPDLTRHAVRRLPFSLVRGAARGVAGAVGTVGRVVSDPVGAVRGVTGFAGSLQRIAGAPPAEPSPLLRGRSLNRRLEAHEVALADLRGAAKAHGCSVNDAYIAAVCGALRHYHDAKGVPIEALPLAMPISLRTGDDPVAGNQWSGARIAAPVGEPDPVTRMRIVREAVLTARSEPAMNAIGALAPALTWLPAQAMSALGDAGSGADVQASNIPGNPRPLYEGGARLLRFVPIGPLPGPAMMIVMTSNAGRCFIGVNYDTAAVTDADLFAKSLRAGFDEVVALAPEVAA